MGTQLSRLSGRMPSFFDDFFKPWNEFFDENGYLTRTPNIPAVNIIEHETDYLVSFAVPGMKKDDFKIDVYGNILTISSEKEDSKEEKDKKYTRKEYRYSSFSRSFNLPEEINKDLINATYVDGVLKISLPRYELTNKAANKQIAVE